MRKHGSHIPSTGISDGIHTEQLENDRSVPDGVQFVQLFNMTGALARSAASQMELTWLLISLSTSRPYLALLWVLVT